MYHGVTLPGMLMLGRASPINFSVIIAIGLDNKIEHYSPNQSRFLILPGVHVPHLASHALSLVARRIRADWQIRYGFAPVLLETFVEWPAAGTSYAAANWIPVGETVGRGRQDRHRTMQLPRKTIWLYPLLRHWRRALTAPWPQWSETEEMDDA